MNNGQVTDTHIEFDLTPEMQVVCPHCHSGWVILTTGVEHGQITKVSFCLVDDAKVPFYCPYCGKDMTKSQEGGNEKK